MKLVHAADFPRAYALVRLLEHGPMRWPELLECTRWPADELRALLAGAARFGVVRILSHGRGGNVAYALGSAGCWSFLSEGGS